MLKKKKDQTDRQYSTETMSDADYIDDLVFLTNTHSQAKSL